MSALGTRPLADEVNTELSALPSRAFLTALFCTALTESLIVSSTITLVAPSAIPPSFVFSALVKSSVDNPLPATTSTFPSRAALVA